MDGSLTTIGSLKITSRLLSVLVVVPALVIAALIYRYGSNMPFWDQWEEYDLFFRVQQHSLTFNDLLAQHNEHRLFFPRLLLIAATLFAPCTDEAELWISWAMACLGSIGLWRLSRFTGWSGGKGILLLVGANVMLFNLLAWEDWLWGFQVGFFLPVLCIIAAVWSVSVSRGGWQFFWAAWWSLINTFSIASGFATWIVLIPLLLFPDGKFQLRGRGLFLHLLGLGACLFLYLDGYIKSSSPPGNLLEALNYFFLYVGAPIADSAPSANGMEMVTCLAAGILMFCSYIICLALLVYFRNQPRLILRSLPWLTLCHYGFCTAALTTIGRMSLGMAQALSSRYVIFSSLITIGLLFAGASLFPAFIRQRNSQRLRHALNILIVALPAACFAFYFWTAGSAIAHWREISENRKQAEAALVFINVPAAVSLLTSSKGAYPDIDALKRFLNERSALGYSPKILANALIAPLADLSSPNPLSGSFASSSEDPTGHTLSGWAYLPGAQRSADLILITMPDSKNQDCVVSMTAPIGYDKTVAGKVDCSDDTPLKWSCVLPPGSNLTGIKAWSFDRLNNRAYLISKESDHIGSR